MVVTPPIEIVSLCFRRAPGASSCSISISSRLDAGELLVLLGPNGAGKSTLVHCLLGLATPEQGHRPRAGRRSARPGRREIAKRIAYVPQAGHSAFAFTVEQMALMGRTAHIDGVGSPSPRDHEITRRAMVDMGVDHLRKKPFTQISGGERQLALIARAARAGHADHRHGRADLEPRSRKSGPRARSDAKARGGRKDASS